MSGTFVSLIMALVLGWAGGCTYSVYSKGSKLSRIFNEMRDAALSKEAYLDERSKALEDQTVMLETWRRGHLAEIAAS